MDPIHDAHCRMLRETASPVWASQSREEEADELAQLAIVAINGMELESHLPILWLRGGD
jgi:hypothetical protein